MITLTQIMQRWETWLSPADSSDDEKRQRVWLTVTLFIAMPAVFVVGLLDTLHGAVLEGVVDMGTALVALAIPFVARQWDRVRPFQRALGVLVISVLTVEIYSGGGDGFAIVWYYFIPPVFVYLTGVREGSLWAVAAVVLIVPALFNLVGVGSYPLALALRFLLTYLLIGVLAAVAESSRLATLTRLHRSYREKALEHTHSATWTNPLPVCMSCKRIGNGEDDNGWERVEDYIAKRANVQISHGLCPSCAADLYPGLGLDR